jgi:protein-tyrosine phosphatase
MKIKNLILAMALIFNTSQALAKDVNILAFDNTENKKSQLPRNFRDLSSLGINAIASAQFSQKQLREVRKKYPNDKITIIDLRRENHGFVNGEALIWHSVFEQENRGKKLSEISSEENERLNLLQKDGQVLVSNIVKRDHENGWYKAIEPQIVQVNQVTSEENLAKKNDFSYQRFLVRDFDVPEDAEFSKMINFIKNLPQDQKLYVHCAGGKGRTGLFLILLDISKNAKNSSLKEIYARQHKLGAAKLDDIS